MAVRAVSSVVGRLVRGGAVLCLSSGVFTRQFTSDAVLKNLFIAKEFYSYASNYGPAVVRSAVFQQEATSPAVGSVEAWRAHRNGRLAFGFSAGGLLFPYYIGVADVFQRNSVIKSGETHLAGASAGSLIAACFNAGVPVDVMVRAVLELAKDCRENGTRGRLKAVLERHLVELLPTNAHQRCSGNTFVAVTQALPYAKGELVSEFSSKEDLIDALLTSCHIPVFFGGSVLTSFRGRYCYDGGVTNFIPLPPSAQHGVRVCCFPAGSIHSQEGIHIAPDLFGRSPYTFTELVNWAFEPAKESVLLRLVEKGRQDAQGWLWQMRRQAQTAAAAQDAARLGRGVPLVDGLSIQC